MTKLEKVATYQKDYKMYPLSTQIYADVTTPINLLKSISNISKDFYLLESVENEDSIGRYTFLGYDPILSVSYKAGVTTVSKDGGSTKLTDDPIEILRKYVDKYRSPQIDSLPPFTGGFVGYMAYEMINYTEPKLNLPSNKYNDFELKLFDKVIAFDNLRKKIIIIVNMKLDNLQENYTNTLAEIGRIVELVRHGNTNTKTAEASKVHFCSNIGLPLYAQMVARAKEYIEQGDIFQVVLSRRFESSYSGSLIDVYRVLRVNNPSPYMYFIKYGDLEICGASPETLVKVVDNKVTTFPVAGSRPRGRNHTEDKEFEYELLQDEKELAEHNMLVDLARNDVGRIAKRGSVEVEEYMEIHRYSRVMHIASVVTGQLHSMYDAFSAISSLLPAGTLSGAPKFRACEIIAELENNPRGIYGGAIGYIDLSGNLDMCIAIRTAVYDGKKIFVQAGAGIVYDSIAESEFNECWHKASAVISAVEAAKDINAF